MVVQPKSALRSGKYAAAAAAEPKSALRSGKYAAAAAAAAAATPLSEPLIPKQSRATDSLSSLESDADEDDATSPRSDDPLSKLSGKDLASALSVALLVTGGLAASASAIIAMPSAAVILMAGFCIVNSPAVANKQLSIIKSAGVHASVNNIRKEIDFLEGEIDFLTHSVDNLQSEAEILAGFEQALQDIAVSQGENVEKIVTMVKENESILKEMKANLKQAFVSAMTMVVMRADKDGDMKIEKKEVPLLALRLQIQLEPYHIKLDTEKFELMIREDNDISNVLKFCGNLLFEDELDEDGDDDSVASGATFDFETFCKSLQENPESLKMTYEEKASMAILDDELCKGSVEVARGKRMTLMTNSMSKKRERKQTIVKEVKRRQTKLAARRGPDRMVVRANTSYRGSF